MENDSVKIKTTDLILWLEHKHSSLLFHFMQQKLLIHWLGDWWGNQ